MENHRQHNGLVGPFILITLGILFLLNNLGMLNLTVWEIVIRLWPILLVGIGLDLIIGRRSIVGSLVVLVLLAGMLLGGIYWMEQGIRPAGTPLDQETFSQEIGKATRAVVNIDFGVGKLQVNPLTDSNNLIEGKANLNRGEKVLRDYNLNGNEATFSLASQGVYVFPFGSAFNDQGWAVEITSSIPVSLSVDSGVSTATMDLSGMTISNLDVNMGLGNLMITLPQKGNVNAQIDGGIGNLTVAIPKDTAVRIEMDGWLGNTNVSSQYTHEGSFYQSANYSLTGDHLDLKIGGGIGNVRVIQSAE